MYFNGELDVLRIQATTSLTILQKSMKIIYQSADLLNNQKHVKYFRYKMLEYYKINPKQKIDIMYLFEICSTSLKRKQMHEKKNIVTKYSVHTKKYTHLQPSKK